MKSVISLALIIAFVFVFSSCSSDSVTFYPEYVKYDAFISETGSNEFRFGLNVISSHRNIDIEFISAEGENTEYITVEFVDETFRGLHTRIDGKCFHIFGVYCHRISDYTRIDSMTLKVNGKEQKITFSSPVEYTSYDSDLYENFLSPKFITCDFSTSDLVARGQDGHVFDFAMTAMDDLTLIDVQFVDFMELTEAVIYVNETEIGRYEEVFPLELKENDNLLISGKIKMKDSNEPYIGTVYTNLVCTYTVNSEQVLHDYFIVSASFIGNREQAKTFVSSVC